jgi:hypothetical protein
MSERTRPSGYIVKITKSNTTDLEKVNGEWPRSLSVGTAGTATFIDASGNTCTDYPLHSGENPISVRRVLESGTADNIWALY